MNKRYNRFAIITASMLVNICIGGGYAWSVFTDPLSKAFGWSTTALALAFTINMGIAPIPMLVSARLQELMGSKFIIVTGGLICGAGFFASGFIKSLPMLYITYGIIIGFGANVAYSAVLSNTVKFFPDKSGLAIGMLLGGYGSGSMIMAPFASSLIIYFGVLNTFKIIGIVLLTVICICSIFIKNAPRDFKPEGWILKPHGKGSTSQTVNNDMDWRQMVSSLRFYIIFLMFAAGIFTGLMITSSASPIGQGMYMLTPGAAALFVGIIAICNGLGRIIGGGLTDRFGSVNVLTFIYIITAVMLLILAGSRHRAAFAVSMIGIGLCYGACMATIPATVTKTYGAKKLAANYGITFIAFTLVSYFAPKIAAGISISNKGDYTKAFYIGVVSVLVGLVTSLIYRIWDKESKAFAVAKRWL